jgi:hypothetical protein
MHTHDLVRMLAADVEPVAPHGGTRRFALALSAGLAAAAMLMVGGLRLRPDIAEAVSMPMFWGKLGFAAAVALPALWLVHRLSHPGTRLGLAPYALPLPLLAMWIAGALALAAAEPQERAALLLGDTWVVCPFLIAMLAAPVFVAVVWAMKGLAPTQLRLAGGAAGLLSGAAGAFVYSLHCPEMAAPFLGTWYLLGMLIPTVVGFRFGRALLRW